MDMFPELPKLDTHLVPLLEPLTFPSRDDSGFRLSGVTPARPLPVPPLVPPHFPGDPVMPTQQLIYPVNVHTLSRVPIESGFRRGEKPWS